MTNRGFTLVELIVMLALMGVLAGVSAFALGTLKPPAQTALVAELIRTRSDALRMGVPVTAEVVWDSIDGRPSTIRFLPDGRAIGDGADPLTGEPRARP
ncbi:MAG TPA: prepilin-type N-terminal cleavage/methylation domain-containing protein [Gemmatimonadales bacterium]|nr:prepilin-type N-terminal cleavage/methylation domain-containing protein [Gemmatimonadales bacterium]